MQHSIVELKLTAQRWRRGIEDRASVCSSLASTAETSANLSPLRVLLSGSAGRLTGNVCVLLCAIPSARQRSFGKFELMARICILFSLVGASRPQSAVEPGRRTAMSSSFSRLTTVIVTFGQFANNPGFWPASSLTRSPMDRSTMPLPALRLEASEFSLLEIRRSSNCCAPCRGPRRSPRSIRI